MIKIYTMSDDPKTNLLKANLEYLGVEYVEINVNSNDAARDFVKDFPLTWLPLLTYKDKIIFRGRWSIPKIYNKERFMNELEESYQRDKPMR